MSEALEEAKKLIIAQEEELKRIANTALTVAIVLFKEENFLYLSSGGGVFRSQDVPKLKITAGDSVLVFSQSNQIIEKIKELPTRGSIHTVIQSGEFSSEITTEGSVISALNGKFKVKKGDRVILDDGRNIILKNLGQETKAHTLSKVPDITWDDIGGLQEAKLEMMEAIELPHTNKDIFLHYSKQITKGILLYGPPGCGKTLLAKAAANSLSKIYKSENNDSENSFIYVKGPEILDKYVGESEFKVRSLFERAKSHKEKFGYPALIFIDEAESILSRRGRGGRSLMSDTLVPMFLTEMDGMEESAALVVLATNRPDILDPAIVRDGRIDRKIKITRPDMKSSAEILKLNLSKTKICKDHKIDEIAAHAAKEIFSSKRRVTNEVNLSHLVNGAMLAGVVGKAISFALRRDIMSGKKSGVGMDDIMKAIDASTYENRDIDLSDIVEEIKEAA